METQQTSLKKSNWRINVRLSNLGTGPEADWKIIFISTVVLTILVVAFSVFIFIKIDKGEIFSVQSSMGEEEKALDLTILRETVSYYQNKALEFERIKSVKIPAVDPSL